MIPSRPVWALSMVASAAVSTMRRPGADSSAGPEGHGNGQQGSRTHTKALKRVAPGCAVVGDIRAPLHHPITLWQAARAAAQAYLVPARKTAAIDHLSLRLSRCSWPPSPSPATPGGRGQPSDFSAEEGAHVSEARHANRPIP